LDDGRKELLIRHEELENVTPEMLLWWFHHLEETMKWHGAIVPRYHVWHPIDHIQFSVERRAADGSVGPGAKWHIVEAFGGNLDFRAYLHTHTPWHSIRDANAPRSILPAPETDQPSPDSTPFLRRQG